MASDSMTGSYFSAVWLGRQLVNLAGEDSGVLECGSPDYWVDDTCLCFSKS